MVQLKGKGALTGVNLVARVYDNGVTKDGKKHYADVQVDARDPRAPGQANLHLKSEKVAGDDGQVRYNNGAQYTAGQIEQIAKVAGPNTEPLRDIDGNAVGMLYGIKGNVMPANTGSGLLVNTTTMQQSEFKVDDSTLNNQFESMRTGQKTQAAAREAGQPDKTAAVEQTPVAQQVEEPAVG